MTDDPYFGDTDPVPPREPWLDSRTPVSASAVSPDNRIDSQPSLSSVSPTTFSERTTSVVVHLRTPWTVRLLVLVLVLVTAAAVTGLFFARKHGNGWMVEARNLEETLAANETLLTDARADLASAEELLSRSEGDVAALEARLASLADEKAQAKDEAAAANISAAYLVDLTRAASDVTTEMGYCIEYQNRWTEVLVDIGNGYVYDDSDIDRFIDAMAQTCASAQSKAEYLRELVDSL